MSDCVIYVVCLLHISCNKLETRPLLFYFPLSIININHDAMKKLIIELHSILYINVVCAEDIDYFLLYEM